MGNHRVTKKTRAQTDLSQTPLHAQACQCAPESTKDIGKDSMCSRAKQDGALCENCPGMWVWLSSPRSKCVSIYLCASVYLHVSIFLWVYVCVHLCSHHMHVPGMMCDVVMCVCMCILCLHMCISVCLCVYSVLRCPLW